MDFIDRITALRIERGISQKTVGERLGCKQSAISKFEKRRSNYSVDDIIALCRFYNVSADYVLGLPPNMPYPERTGVPTKSK